jgi:hypothetical protein
MPPPLTRNLHFRTSESDSAQSGFLLRNPERLNCEPPLPPGQAISEKRLPNNSSVRDVGVSGVIWPQFLCLGIVCSQGRSWTCEDRQGRTGSGGEGTAIAAGWEAVAPNASLRRERPFKTRRRAPHKSACGRQSPVLRADHALHREWSGAAGSSPTSVRFGDDSGIGRRAHVEFGGWRSSSYCIGGDSRRRMSARGPL